MEDVAHAMVAPIVTILIQFLSALPLTWPKVRQRFVPFESNLILIPDLCINIQVEQLYHKTFYFESLFKKKKSKLRLLFKGWSGNVIDAYCKNISTYYQNTNGYPYGRFKNSPFLSSILSNRYITVVLHSLQCNTITVATRQYNQKLPIFLHFFSNCHAEVLAKIRLSSRPKHKNVTLAQPKYSTIYKESVFMQSILLHFIQIYVHSRLFFGSVYFLLVRSFPHYLGVLLLFF